MNRLHKPKQSGFSLLELLVVIGLMGVVATLGVTAFSSMLVQLRETKILVELDNNANTVFKHIEKDLSDVLSAELSGVSIAGEDRIWQDDTEFKAAPDQNDRIVIPIQGHSSDYYTKPFSIQYELKRMNGESSLFRSESELGKNEWTATVNLIDGVDTIAFDIQYATDTGWVDEWTSSKLPKAFRVSIAVADRDFPALQLIRKAVYTIAVQ